jgi:hypothetical protein
MPLRGTREAMKGTSALAPSGWSLPKSPAGQRGWTSTARLRYQGEKVRTSVFPLPRERVDRGRRPAQRDRRGPGEGALPKFSRQSMAFRALELLHLKGWVSTPSELTANRSGRQPLRSSPMRQSYGRLGMIRTNSPFRPPSSGPRKDKKAGSRKTRLFSLPTYPP